LNFIEENEIPQFAADIIVAALEESLRYEVLERSQGKVKK